MRLTCDVNKGGCGCKFDVTDELVETFRRLIEENKGGGCPNPECSRVLSPGTLACVVHLIDTKNGKADPWPGFPLSAPVVPDSRRKNGALPGVNFKKIAEKAPDRAPTPEEILRVQRYFAQQLEEGIDCPCCTRHAKRQRRLLGCGPARWLIELVYLSDKGQAIHTGEIIKSLKGNNVSGSDATSVLPLYGLIEAASDPAGGINSPPPSAARAKRTSGFWRPTKLGRAFALDKVKVPAKVVTCLGVPEEFEGELVSIKDALGTKFNYAEIMGRATK